MLYDIGTIAGKELKEILIQRGSLRGGVMNILIYIAISGILFPLQMGVAWVTSPLGLLSVSWLPLFTSMGLVADAFAGERERHTLETLLASRLSDRAILYGKMTAGVVYGLAIAVAGMLLGALTTNVLHPGAGFYPLPYFIGALVFSLLGMLLVTGVGVLVSLHANNVRQAYQRMSLGFLLLWLPVIIGPQFMPDAWKQQLGQSLQYVDGLQVAVAIGAFLLVLDLALVLAATVRFQRARLILD